MKSIVQRTVLACLAVSGAAVLMAPGIASAALPSRSWVSGNGNDGNDCSHGSPCLTFATALTKTAAHGEIDAMDNGGFGPVTINKSITIAGNGIGTASVMASASDGIVVAAGPTDVVTLRGLQVTGSATGTNGIHMTSGATLKIQDCVVEQFSGVGILDNSNQAHQIFVTNTSVTDNTGGGIIIAPTGGPTLATVTGVRAESNALGIKIDSSGASGPVGMTIEDSTVAGNVNAGINALSGGGGQSADLIIIRTTVAGNGTDGVKASGAAATAKIGGSIVTHNFGVALHALSGAVVDSFGNNEIKSNQGGDGTFTATALK